MAEHILLLTGHLAHASVQRVLDEMDDRPFTFDVHDIGVSVAALMTTAMIERRLAGPANADRVLVPGYCAGDLDALARHLGVPVERGPKEIMDLPEFFGGKARTPDLSGYSTRIFAEIVDAPDLDLDGVMRRAGAYRDAGADVIDIGCLPGRPFTLMEPMVEALVAADYTVSIDSLDPDELRRGARAGASYVLSLQEDTLWLADEVDATPVLIPASPGDLDSLCRAAAEMTRRGRDFFVDPILDPIHFGFTASIVRYAAIRERLPDAAIFMGIGNLTELTDGDTTGMTALLMGLVSELDVAAVLTTQVSPHARSVVRETDLARRVTHAARRDASLPRGYHPGLMALRDRKPFPHTEADIERTAGAIRDPNFRVQVSARGIHVYNRDALRFGTDAFAVFPSLGLEDDGAHAFYMGVELARAEIAWQLGKRYVQDEPLRWGCAVPETPEDLTEHRLPGTTLRRRRKRKKT